MPLHPNNTYLVNTLQSMAKLDGRFEQIKFVNYNSVSDQKRGCFSLVFSAFDSVHQKKVALKFYDLDPQWTMDTYRQQAFRREHEILQVLIDKHRCLQLASALCTLNLDVSLPNGSSIVLPCYYFAVDWVDEDIDDYFLQQGSFDPIQKLKIFHEITLAIEALHNLEIFHRDIKADNLRAYQKQLERIVVAIDLGTAARLSSVHLKSNYSHTVGARAYAGLEAICGLAGNRLIAPYTDKYALGCLLYELFNHDYFYRELVRCNQHYEQLSLILPTFNQGIVDEYQQLANWKSAIRRFGSGVSKVKIDPLGNSVPPAIANILDDVLGKLTDINYEHRPNLNWVRNRINSAIKVMKNESIYQEKLRLAKIRKIKRIEKNERAQAKLNSYLARKTHA